MAVFLTVANRKGGVGKSTMAILMAQAFSIWGKKRVLVVDLDSQCNASIILLGGDSWYKASASGRTVAEFVRDQCNGHSSPAASFLLDNAGDLLDAEGEPPALSLLPGSVALDDIQGELFMAEMLSADSNAIDLAIKVRQRLERMLRQFEDVFDIIIIDSAPGLSFATHAALEIADKILIPFRLDVVSQMAVDRVALLIEHQSNIERLAQVPFDQRRYVCVANFVHRNGRERLILEEINVLHPVLTTSMPYSRDIAEAFDWFEHRVSLEDKYGDAARDIRHVYDELCQFLPS